MAGEGGNKLTPIEHSCDKGPAIEMIHDATKAIFDKLDDMSKVLQDVALQKKDIEHLEKNFGRIEQDVKSELRAVDSRMTQFEKKCQQRHGAPRQTLVQEVFRAVVVAVAATASVGFFSLSLYIMYVNVAGWMNFPKHQEATQSAEIISPITKGEKR